VTARPIITLLTDFGTQDPYVGMMKGVIAGICPDANVIDLTHEVPPHDVRIGAFFLERARPYFPKGTVHLAVVDPGVGTSRGRIALVAGGQFFVGPDNGLLRLAARRYRAVALTRPSFFLPRVSNTFHGRDVFAPAAAHLAQGAPLSHLGPLKRRIVEIPWPKPRRGKLGVVAEIISVDRFGNLITNLEPTHWRSIRHPRLSAGEFTSTKLSKSYEAVRKGEIVLVFGGYGLLEIAARNASAAKVLGVGPGAPVYLSRG
jgi:S-adenosylmethionine hydrolase